MALFFLQRKQNPAYIKRGRHSRQLSLSVLPFSLNKPLGGVKHPQSEQLRFLLSYLIKCGR